MNLPKRDDDDDGWSWDWLMIVVNPILVLVIMTTLRKTPEHLVMVVLLGGFFIYHALRIVGRLRNKR